MYKRQIYTCIDKVSEKIETQIHKYRQRLIKRGRGVSRDYVASMPEEHWVEDDKPVRTKTFTTKPMNLEEAIMQMNLCILYTSWRMPSRGRV